MKQVTGILCAALLAVTALFAAEFTTTGSGIRVKKIAFVKVQVYSLTHQIAGTMPEKSATAVMNADVDKRFILTMKRDIDSQKIVAAINDAYAMNGYANKANQNTLFGVLSGDMKTGDQLIITYNAANKTTTSSYKGKTASVAGVDFMKATWAIWFGKIDQPGLTQALIANMK